MNYLNLFTKISDYFIYYYKTVNISMIIAGLSIILLIVILVNIKNYFFRDISLINHAKTKFDRKSKKIRILKAKAKIASSPITAKKHVFAVKKD